MKVLDIVSREFGFSKTNLLASTRSSREIAFARQVAMYLSYYSDPSHPTYTAVGKEYKRDRTTVRHACEVVIANRDREDFDMLIRKLEDECTAAFVRSGKSMDATEPK